MKLDYETLTNELIVTYGINEDCQIEGGIYMRSLFGGCMDSFIQGFHRTVGMDEGGRENVGKNQKHIYIAPSQTQPGINTDQQGVPDNHSIFADFTLQKTLLHGGDPFPSVAVEATAGP